MERAIENLQNRRQDHRQEEDAHEIRDQVDRTTAEVNSLRSRADDLEARMEGRINALADANEGRGKDLYTIRDAAIRAASQHAADIREIVEAEREDAATQRQAERDVLTEALEARHLKEVEERDRRIFDLEDQLTELKRQLEDERTKLLVPDQARAEDRAVLENYATDTMRQLNTLSDVVQQQGHELTDDRSRMMNEMSTIHGQTAQTNEELRQMRSMMEALHTHMQENQARRPEKDDRNQKLERMVMDLTAQCAQQQEVLNELLRNWREVYPADHQEILHTIEQKAHEQVDFNIQGVSLIYIYTNP